MDGKGKSLYGFENLNFDLGNSSVRELEYADIS